MDRLARPKDDLFDNSTMTFGEHLEELRHSLVRAILWLAAGLIFGLFFADSVVLFVKTPLESAIQQFNELMGQFLRGTQREVWLMPP